MNLQSRRLIELHAAAGRDQARFGRIPVKRLQSLELVVAEDVPDIIAQVSPGHGLTLRIGRVVRAGDLVRLGHPEIPRALQPRHIGGTDRTGPAGPDCVYERQSGGLRPELAEIDLADAWWRLQEERDVADDQRRVGAFQHRLEIRRHRHRLRRRTEYPRQQHARQRDGRPRAGIHRDAADIARLDARVNRHRGHRTAGRHRRTGNEDVWLWAAQILDRGNETDVDRVRVEQPGAFR